MSEALRRKLEEEVRALEYELNRELPQELKKAVAHGDLSENAEYTAARERQDYVKARLGQLGKRLADVSLVNMNNIPRDSAGFGSTVMVYDVGKGVEVEYKIVTSEEADVAKGMISTSSPIGRSLLGKKVGDLVTVQTPAGKKEFEILKLTTIHDEASAGG
jgi:transcription elongation factor GreA